MLMLLPLTGLNIGAYLLWALVLAWIVSLVLTLYGRARQRLLLPLNEAAPHTHDEPLVSIVVPARNEEHRVLSDSIGSILAQDYRAFEVIAIDDRSSDGTLSVLRSLAEVDRRLHVIEGEDLPVG